VSLNPRIPSFAGKRVWVVGASYGIGAEIARELLQRGARVALSARKRELLAQVAGDAGEALIAELDITNRDSIRHAASVIDGRWGGYDLALIVAGTHVEMRAQTWDLAAAKRLLDVNLIGVLHCLDVIIPALRKQRSGGIGIVSSMAGYVGLPKALIYGPSKAALINLAESLYGDLHPEGIGVYLINPGFVDTPLTQKNEFSMPALMSARAAALATLDGIAAGRFEIHYPARFTAWFKLLRMLPYRLQFAAVRRVTGL